MSRYGSVSLVSADSAFSLVVESADADDLARRVNAAIASLPGTYTVIALTLAGAGDGHTFTVTIEAGLIADVTDGGFSSPPTVLCYLAADAEALERVQRLPPSGTLVDTQIAGSSKGTRFMGMVVLGALIPPSGGGTGPTGPTGPGSSVDSLGPFGFDQVVVTNIAFNNAYSGTGGLEVMRDNVGNPMEVVLTGLTPGATVRVAYTLTVCPDIPGFQFGGTGAWISVSFDNAPAAFPTGWLNVNNSTSQNWIQTDNSGLQPFMLASLSVVCWFIVPAGKTKATLRVRQAMSLDGPALQMTYVGLDQTVLVGEAGNGFMGGCSLEAWQIPAALVQQPGPGTLVVPNAP